MSEGAARKLHAALKAEAVMLAEAVHLARKYSLTLKCVNQWEEIIHKRCPARTGTCIRQTGRKIDMKVEGRVSLNMYANTTLH